MNIKDYVARDNGNLEGLVRLQAETNLETTAVICEPRRLSDAELDRCFECTAKHSDHSTRIGPTQDLTTAGAALPEIMAAGRWRSPRMPSRYARRLDARRGAMREWRTRR